MTTPVFPTLPGLTFPVKREPNFNTTRILSASGKETRIARWEYPIWNFEISFDVLRSAAAFQEFQKLGGFFGQMRGGYSPFLFQFDDDYTVTGQALGTGDGVEDTFQLVRTFGAGGFTFNEPIYAPNVAATKIAYVNGVADANVTWNDYDASDPGTLVFDTPPGAALPVTATFSYYFPCRFDDDGMSFEQFMRTLYNARRVGFSSIK